MILNMGQARTVKANDVNPQETDIYLAGHDGEIHIAALAALLARLVLALSLVSSALAVFDRAKLASWEIALRLARAALVSVKPETIYIAACVVAVGIVLFHHRQSGAAAVSA